MGKSKESRVVDLVDDVWRLVFYILACDCKDLGRAMQVGRRFHNLIANDALLWRLTYNLTISGSIFAGQKPLLSPTWIREQQQAGQEASGSLSFTHQGQMGSASNGAPSHMLDRNEDGLDSMPSNTDEHGLRRGSIGHRGAESSSALCGLGSASASTLSALASSRLQSGSWSTGALQPNNSGDINNGVRTSVAPVVIAPGLQMPSPLILPHHRRIAQSMTDVNSSSSQATTPAQVASAPSTQPSYFTGTSSTNSTTENFEHTSTTRTPASTPATMSMPSFASTLPPSVSQVTSSSSSTTPIRVIQHHIPSTTLMHHSPAVYWKHQVVEWLEQEKLRCLRLGLFWGFSAAASRAHGRKTNRAR
ncbi:hypothetical protein BGW39_001812 [Mortierella sp. 14UC]|nr:hypothetical protein BGW39_001812 [Mortierella sp. 14UC]